MTASPPEPLRAFAAAPASADALRRVDTLAERTRSLRTAGLILPNAVEAMRVELTYHSNALEGSTLTLRDTAMVVEGREPNTGKSLREIDEARNHDRALRMVEGWVGTRPAEPLTEADLLAVHREVLADIDRDGAGHFRAGRVFITGTRFVPPSGAKFPQLLQALLELANRPSLHPVLQAAELHSNFVAVHPFGDGNGRTARLLMNLHLLQRGFPHAIVPVEYLAALDEANAGRVEPFTTFIASCVEDSTRRLIGDFEV